MRQQPVSVTQTMNRNERTILELGDSENESM
jgi:hypothetical protein